MHPIWQIALVGWLYAADVCAQFIKPEFVHDPMRFTTTEKTVNESEYTIDRDFTPDWRIEEIPPGPGYDKIWFNEQDRPYRISPYYKQTYVYDNYVPNVWMKAGRANPDSPWKFGCYCCTVYKRLTPLSTCAVITTRHILTTATATELILKDYDKEPNLENILGFWYDHGGNVYNSSIYASVSRIHYHPRYVMPNNVNASHPIPCMFDIAVWAATHPFYWKIMPSSGVAICERASPFSYENRPPNIDWQREMGMVIGFQFMLFYKKVPMPFFKYVVRTKRILETCPKSEWGWFFCVDGFFAQLGLESGAILHRSENNAILRTRYDGLLGLHSFSMTLRAHKMTHYFTVLDNHPVLEFLYDAYMGTIPYRYLDGRFYDTRMKAPIPKPWFYIEWKYELGSETSYFDYNPHWYPVNPTPYR